MDEAQVIVDFLLPTHKQASGAVGPRVTAFHDPTAGTGSFAKSACIGASRRNVWHITAATSESLHRFSELAFVQAEMLPGSSLGLGAWHGDRLQGSAKKLLIMRVRTGDRHAHRHAARVGQHRTLDPQLTAIGWVFAGFLPHPREPWSSCHRA